MSERGVTQHVSLAYGRDRLRVRAPERASVVLPRDVPGVAGEANAIRSALRAPIGSAALTALVPRGATVGISICDGTRPFPGRRALPPLLDELDRAGAGPITIFVATGTHRRTTGAEIEAMLGADLLARARVVQHDAFDADRHWTLGTVPGSNVPARVDGEFLDQAVRITTGFIEPHFFAGFSGGPKMVAPGLAQLETVLELHSAARIGDPRATWGVVEGNPVHEPIRAIASRAGITLNLDVTLNRDREITGVYAGDLLRSHTAGCAAARRDAMAAVAGPQDLVVTTNSGYPLDQNLYQTVKGMSAAAQIVRPGGVILVASECSDGLPEHGRYAALLHEGRGPEPFLEALAGAPTPQHDQWQVQIQARIQRRARVLLHCRGLTADQVRGAWLEPVDDVQSALDELSARAATVAILPDGPQTIPYLAA
ncbi:MAG: nickel-dependent lactate racemase [Candidatus Dormiibacterota bacterium]